MAKRSAKEKLSLTRKIIANHLVEGAMNPGEEIALKVDQTITQDTTGTLTYLQLEALGVERAQTAKSVSYCDTNLLQLSFESADDHRFLQTIASKMGVHFSRPGNGICHKVHLERFAVPGELLLGTDSHVTAMGGAGMLSIGAGGLDVALAMAGDPFRMEMPKVVKVELTGRPASWIGSKDIALELLRRMTVRGGLGRVLEFTGEGLKYLSVSERGVIANMCAELGATAAIFPSDTMTRQYLKRQRRSGAYKATAADKGAEYDEEISVNLRQLKPLVACPGSPDNVVLASELSDVAVNQVCIGGSTNSTYRNLMTVAQILRGGTVSPDVSLTVTPGSRQVLLNITSNGALHEMIKSGARIMEASYGPSSGIGQAPESGAVSLRTFNRNYPGISATKDSEVYLCGPAVAAFSALEGRIVDPTSTGKRAPSIRMPDTFEVDDSQVLEPAAKPERVTVVRGPNIRPVPMKSALPQDLNGAVLLRLGDNITTDDILPTSPRALALRSNIAKLADYTFYHTDPTFVRRTKSVGGGFIVAGENYGQGAAREHAALTPMYLGVKAVIARSFARIHRQNLINCGILPLVFQDEATYNDVSQGDAIEIPFARIFLDDEKPLVVKNVTTHKNYSVEHHLTRRQIDTILAGGLLNMTRKAHGLETPESKTKGRRNR